MHVVLYIFCVLRYFLMGAACFSQGSNLNEKKALGKHGDVNIAFVGVVGERAKSVKTKQSKRKKKLKAPPLKHAPTHQEQESQPDSETSSTRSNIDVKAAFSVVSTPAPTAVNPLRPPDVAELPFWIPTSGIATAAECGFCESSQERSFMSQDTSGEDHLDYPKSVDPFELESPTVTEKSEPVERARPVETLKSIRKRQLRAIRALKKRTAMWLGHITMTPDQVSPDHIQVDDVHEFTAMEVFDELDECRRASTFHPK